MRRALALVLFLGCNGSETSPTGSGGSGGVGDDAGTNDDDGAGDASGGDDGGGNPDPSLSFFVTSSGNGALAGNFGGLSGADSFCTDLATAAGINGRTWAAYLSTASVDARDRIGSGPWYNALGQQIAASVATLHSNGIDADLVVDEYGDSIDLANAHDIVTGASEDGGFDPDGANCNDFTSNSPDVYTAVGHANGGGVGQGAGGGSAGQSWNAAHLTACDQAGMQSTAGQSHLYCFATD